MMVPMFGLAIFFAGIAAVLSAIIPAKLRSAVKGILIGMPTGIAIWMVVLGVVWRICRWS